MTPHILSLNLGPVQTNCYLVGDDETKIAVAIDPGDEAPRVVQALAQREWTLRHILLTHTHFDHTGAVADLLEAAPVPLAAHPLEKPLLRAKGGAALFGMSVRACPEPDVWLEPGRDLAVGPFTFQVLFVPGHTPGHVAFYEPALGAVFSGDVLFKEGIGRTDFPGSSHAALMRSIREVLFALPDETLVCSGHGPITTIGEEKTGNPFLAG